MIVVSVSNDHLELATEDRDELCSLAQAIFRTDPSLPINVIGCYYLSVTILRKALTNDDFSNTLSGTHGRESQLDAFGSS